MYRTIPYCWKSKNQAFMSNNYSKIQRSWHCSKHQVFLFGRCTSPCSFLDLASSIWFFFFNLRRKQESHSLAGAKIITHSGTNQVELCPRNLKRRCVSSENTQKERKTSVIFRPFFFCTRTLYFPVLFKTRKGTVFRRSVSRKRVWPNTLIWMWSTSSYLGFAPRQLCPAERNMIWREEAASWSLSLDE